MGQWEEIAATLKSNLVREPSQHKSEGPALSVAMRVGTQAWLWSVFRAGFAELSSSRQVTRLVAPEVASASRTFSRLCRVSPLPPAAPCAAQQLPMLRARPWLRVPGFPRQQALAFAPALSTHAGPNVANDQAHEHTTRASWRFEPPGKLFPCSFDLRAKMLASACGSQGPEAGEYF